MPIKLAQYGIAHAHAAGKANVLKAHPEVEFAGVFEPDTALRAERGSPAAYEGVHWFAAKEDLLDDDAIVGVAVEGRVRDNLRFARECLERGKHIWLDKPAGEDLEEFRRLLDLAREQGLLVQLGYMFRYNAGFQFILDWADSGRLGDVFAVRGRMSTNVSEATRQELSFHQGGILFELLCHLLDIVVYLLGRPRRVTSFLRNDLGPVPEFCDHTATVLEYDRALAILESAAMEQEPFAVRRLEVYGTRGSAILEPLEPPQLRLCLDEARDGYAKGWQPVPVEDRPRYVACLDAFLADIRGEKTPDRSLDHEFLVQETLLRATGVVE
jgi:predicted dehydrogenase